MNVGSKLPKYLVFTVLAAGLGVSVWPSLWPTGTKGYVVNVNEPELTAVGRSGKLLFEANCASCHGLKGAGTDKGPPLVHDIYNPGHHSDAAFFLAAQQGVRQHHWRFGNMPPQRQVSEPQITAIVQYVRELQVANGIRYRPHRM